MDKDSAIQYLLAISPAETFRVLGCYFVAMLPAQTNLTNVSASTISSTIVSNIKSYSSNRSDISILYLNPSKKEFIERDFEEQFANKSIQTEYYDGKNVSKSEAHNMYISLVNDRYRTIKALKMNAQSYQITNVTETDKVLTAASICGNTVQRMVLTTFASSISLAKVMLDNLCSSNAASMKIASFIKSCSVNNSLKELVQIYNANMTYLNQIKNYVSESLGDDYEEGKEGESSKLFTNILNAKKQMIQTTWKQYPEGTIFIAALSKGEFKQFASNYFTYCKPHSYIKFDVRDLEFGISTLERKNESLNSKLIGQLLKHEWNDKYVIAIIRTNNGLAYHSLK